MARPLKPTEEAPPPWKDDIPFERYEETARKLVHFSRKTINSNIPPGGVRLHPEQGLRLPYVSARTLLAAGENLALDYIANSEDTATVVKQLHQISDGRHSADAQMAARLQQLLADTQASGGESGNPAISLRARQLLLPRDDGSYVAITPISAGGVASLQRKRVNAHEEARRNPPSTTPAPADNPPLAPGKIPRRIVTAQIKLGGQKPMNVGALAWEMQHPLVSFAPTEKRAIKRALALYFQGPSLQLPTQHLLALRHWYHHQRASHGGEISTNMVTRDAEIQRIRALARAVLAQGRFARRQLILHRDVLPLEGTPLISPTLPLLIQGMVEPQLAGEAWPQEFAQWFVRHLADHRFNDREGEFQFDQADRHQIARMAEAAARRYAQGSRS